METDRERLLQVLGNLLDNVINDTPEGGSITLTAAPARGAAVRIAVSDEWHGIAEGTRVRLFEPFWQKAPGRHGGAGLGLFIAKAIVEAHGGHIWAENRPWGGASFSFTLAASAS